MVTRTVATHVPLCGHWVYSCTVISIYITCCALGAASPTRTALGMSGAAALTPSVAVQLTLTEHRSHSLCCSRNSHLCMPQQMWQCLTGEQEEPSMGLSSSLMRMLLPDWAASALICQYVLTCDRAEHEQKTFIILFCFFLCSWTMQEDYAGYDFENRLHVRIHSALASMRAAAQPWPSFTCNSERTGRNCIW